MIGRAYRWFLDLPGPVVVTVLWLAGAALIDLCAGALYLLWSLLWTVAGA